MQVQQSTISTDLLKKAFKLLVTAKSLAELYEEEKAITGKYVHATSRGHEAIQIATGLQLTPQDYLSAYYRDDAMLLSIGITPYDLMLQLLAKRDDIFSGGRTYYSHPSLNHPIYPKIPHQSSATGMQAIPTTGIAMGIQYAKKMELLNDENPIVVCSLGDACCTEGEVSEALQMAVLKSLPILYLVQDNEWDISASADEIRAQDMAHFAKGFSGLEVFSINGSNFIESYATIQKALYIIRNESRPVLVHAKVPLLNHHTSGVRKEWYRDDLEEAQERDPYDKLRQDLLDHGINLTELDAIEDEIRSLVKADFEKAQLAEDAKPEDL